MKKNPNDTKSIPRDSGTASPWQEINKLQIPAPELNSEKIYDVLIVGAGITGLTAALMLQKQQKSVIIAEAANIGFGTTGGTSAHLNTFFDATYPEIERDFGDAAAKLVAKCGKEAFSIIRKFAEELNIACDLEFKDGYVFSEKEQETEQLEKMFTASRSAGLAVSKTTDVSVPIPFKAAIKYAKQGQFHPLKYIAGLAKEFISKGGIILEQTFINEVKHDDGFCIAQAGDKIIKAKDLIYATHIPPGITLFSFRCAPYRSYVLGLKLKDDNYTPDLVYDMQEPYHYFRTHVINGQKILLVGGEDHKTGHDDPEKAFKSLEKYVNKYYDVAEVRYQWSSQYYTPVDGLPYIGLMPFGNQHVYIATGFNGNGMTFGTIAGKILTDLIVGNENEYADLFNPSRIKPVAGFTEFIKENADVAYHFVADRFNVKHEAVKSIKPGTGEVIDYEGERVAVYKDQSGEIHALSPVCTHAGCIVNFNAVEKSWDCPCHGGRFDIDGKILNGPPLRDLGAFKI